MSSTLSYVWYFLFLVPLILFVILDGADLGLGIISLARSKPERAKLIDSIGPLWYANETWLVVAVATLFGAFPLAYSLVLSSLYVPMMLVVFGVILRAASAEFRSHTGNKDFWSIVFGVGCLLAVLGQGFLLGGLLSNLKIQNNIYQGGVWGWFGSTTVVTALAVIAAYVMLGALQTAKKQETDKALKLKALRGIIVTSFILFVVAAVLLAMQADFRKYAWTLPHILFVLFFAVTAISGYLILMLTSARTTMRNTSYSWVIVILLSFFGVIFSATFPYLVPFSISVIDAAAPQRTQVFMLPGVGAVLFLIIVYNVYVKRVFMGERR
jgi:cytochrome d ubiquinol oxidase subunit II